MHVKKKLAHTIVSELYSKEKADKAKESFEKTVQNKELPSDIKKLKLKRYSGCRFHSK